MPQAAVAILVVGVAFGAAVAVPQIQRLVASTATPGAFETTGGALARGAAAVLLLEGRDSVEALSPALVTVSIPAADGSVTRAGSGFIWDGGGHVVTSAHLVRDARSVRVTLDDGRQVQATVRAADPPSDLAVLELTEMPAPLATLPLGDIDRVVAGDPVMVLDVAGDRRVSRGVVRAVGKLLPVGAEIADGAQYSIPDVLATDLSVGEAASGSPLLNERGEVIGLNLPVKAKGRSYAVPVSLIERVVPALIARGTYEHPWLGLSGRTITAELAETLGLPETHGVLVLTVLPSSPAAEAGLRQGEALIQFGENLLRVGGDVIVGINGEPTNTVNDLVTYVARYGSAGKPVTLNVVRDGQSQSVTVILGARPSIPILD